MPSRTWYTVCMELEVEILRVNAWSISHGSRALGPSPPLQGVPCLLSSAPAQGPGARAAEAFDGGPVPDSGDAGR